ncbi:MAG TPA: multicopper oxidase domain-containing protein [Candidatus Elarobacter sp.]|nr:multicopper oxidase domain-containing protein [Candidatus Elarobacter sp.]
MQFSRRGLLLASLALTTSALAVPLGAHRHDAAAAAAGAATAPCIANAPTPVPGSRPARIPLPTPPVQDTTRSGQSNFTLYVKSNADGAHFCYTTTPNGQLTYTEAPTIVARRGGTFTMTLVNEIPTPSSPSPLPTPPRLTGDVDGCAWIPYEGEALPEPSRSSPAPGYFNHPRAQHPGMPPWMISSDTNFHTHGWHVSPYVDNVFKSLYYAPNRNTCVFKFTVPVSQPPGTYWYHSHMHGFSNTQVSGGLAGALIVVPNTPNVPDVLLLIKNASGAQTGTLAQAAPMAMGEAMGGSTSVQRSLDAHYARVLSARPAATPSGAPVPFDPFNPPPWYAPEKITTPYCAPLPTSPSAVRDPLAVNGALIPVVIGGVKTPAAGPGVTQFYGTTVRYRVLNASADSYVNLATRTASGAPVDLNVVGRDGVPVNWNPATSSVDPSKPAVIREPNVFVAPSQRVDIVVTMQSTPLRLVSLAGVPANHGAPPTNTPYCQGYDGPGPIPERELLTIQPAFEAKRGAVLTAAAPKPLHAFTVAGAFARSAAGIPRRAISFTQYPAPAPDFGEWYVTETAPLTPRNAPPPTSPVFTERPFFLAPGTSPSHAFPYVPWIRVHQNSTEEWDLFNTTPEIHAFHIHQLTFVAIQSPFEATDPYRQVFLDSIPLPAATLVPGPGSPQKLVPSVTKIVIDFHHVDTGVFVFHCHMLFHEDHGMMGIVEVLPPLTAAKAHT